MKFTTLLITMQRWFLTEVKCKLCVQVCPQRGTLPETGTSLRTPASSALQRQQAILQRLNLLRQAPPHPPSPARLPPPPSAHHLTPALIRHPPSARLQSPVPQFPRLSARPQSPSPRLHPPCAPLRSPGHQHLPPDTSPLTSAALLPPPDARLWSLISLSCLRTTVALMRSTSPLQQPGNSKVTSVFVAPVPKEKIFPLLFLRH